MRKLRGRFAALVPMRRSSVDNRVREADEFAAWAANLADALEDTLFTEGPHDAAMKVWHDFVSWGEAGPAQRE